MRLFSRKKEPLEPLLTTIHQSTKVLLDEKPGISRKGQTRYPVFTPGDFGPSQRNRISLYRFLAREIPVVQACIATWVRMSAAPTHFTLRESVPVSVESSARDRLDQLCARLNSGDPGGSGSLASFLPQLFLGLYRDGAFAGYLKVTDDGEVESFRPVDAGAIVLDTAGNKQRLFFEIDDKLIPLDSPDFYYLPLNADSTRPLGSSILQTIPFVSYIQQQLVDDMRRTSHNAGYHRLHVKVTPPERVSGESDRAYIDRINSYFDSTVSMIRSCKIDENPVTWDNVAIDHIGPENVRAVTNSWFMNHRAMVEEICAGTNLAPFMLGYSYGATSTWSSFKFDLVMRQVRSVQAQVASFLEWIGNIELALAGIPTRCQFAFDNTYAYQAADASSIKAREVEGLLKLFESGLIDESTARQKALQLLS